MLFMFPHLQIENIICSAYAWSKWWLKLNIFIERKLKSVHRKFTSHAELFALDFDSFQIYAQSVCDEQ